MLNMRKLAVAASLLLTLAFAPVSEARDTFYIAPSQVSLIKVLQPPPAPDSQAQKDDLKAVLDAQESRTEDQARSAVADNDASLFAFVAVVLGPNFKKENLKTAAPFFERVSADQVEAAWGTKEYFNRPRPSMIEPRIKPIVRLPLSASYPSGHTITGYVYATVLAMMLPEKAQELYQRAAAYGRNRVIAGVHYPTDVESGRVSAAVIVNALLQQPLFMRDFERAKTEVRQAVGLK